MEPHPSATQRPGRDSAAARLADELEGLVVSEFISNFGRW
jgi:hypothetical protein